MMLNSVIAVTVIDIARTRSTSWGAMCVEPLCYGRSGHVVRLQTFTAS